MKRILLAAIGLWFMAFAGASSGDDVGAAAQAALRKAFKAMATLQRNGGWANAWSVDGKLTWGEFLATPAGWITVQPPATPGTAGVFLRAARLLDNDDYAARAREARDALLKLQTVEGGFPHQGDPTTGPARPGSFDDGVTTGALHLFIDLWAFSKDQQDLAAVMSTGNFLLTSQYQDSGGWPWGYPSAAGTYQGHITFNDGVMSNVLTALVRLHEVTGDKRFFDAAVRGGDCIIALQGAPGEEIWAQQYDPQMLKPAAARSFEPAGYSAGESPAVCTTLIDLYVATGFERFLEPLSKAFAWYEAHRLPNGKWARLYEPGTQLPVYGGSGATGPVYDIAQARAGYAWQGDWYPRSAKRAYDRIREVGREMYIAERNLATPPPRAATLVSRVREICAALSPEGFWIEVPTSGAMTMELAKTGAPKKEWRVITSSTFCRNATVLLDYIERVRTEAGGDGT